MGYVLAFVPTVTILSTLTARFLRPHLQERVAVQQNRGCSPRYSVRCHREPNQVRRASPHSSLSHPEGRRRCWFARPGALADLFSEASPTKLCAGQLSTSRAPLPAAQGCP